MRRRITGVGAPGTFGGRHHSTYRDEIAAMFALGQTDAVEELLLGLLDAVEDEVAELGTPLDPTFFLTLADLYHDCGRTEDLAALQDRFAAAEARSELGVAARAAAPPARRTPGGGGAPRRPVEPDFAPAPRAGAPPRSLADVDALAVAAGPAIPTEGADGRDLPTAGPPAPDVEAPGTRVHVPAPGP